MVLFPPRCLNSALLLLFSLSGSDGAAFSPRHPCKAFPTKVSKLIACPTASTFCSSYLGGTASFTRTTRTTTTTTLATPTTTTTITTTVTTDTVTLTAPTSTKEVEDTTTVTTTSNVCPPTNNKPRRDVLPRAPPGATKSCGIFPHAKPFKVSGACNCILASSTTKTSTAVVSGTSTVTNEITSASTTVTSTPTTVVTTGTSTVIECTMEGPRCQPTSTNVLANGGFEDTDASGQTSSWIVDGDGSTAFIKDPVNAYEGSYYARLTINTANQVAQISQTINNLDPLLNYVLNITTKVNSRPPTNAACQFYVYDGDTEIAVENYKNIQFSAYRPYLITLRPSASTVNLIFQWYCYSIFSSQQSTGDIFLDEVTLITPDLTTCAMTIRATVGDPGIIGSYLQYPSPAASANFFTPDAGSATQYTLDQHGNIIVIGSLGQNFKYWTQDYLASFNSGDLIRVETVDVAKSPFVRSFPTCSVQPTLNTFTCSNVGPNVLGSHENGADLALWLTTLGGVLTNGVTPAVFVVDYVNYSPGI